MERIREWIVQRGLSQVSGKRSRSQNAAAKPSIALIHFADRFTATTGETIAFTAWMLNDSRETLTGVSLIERSFTNANLENLSYDTGPHSEELRRGSLEPGESAELHFSYVVREEDVIHRGEIVNALQVRAVSSAGVIWDECDATVQLYPKKLGNSRENGHITPLLDVI
ncbi:DUF7507 domain-containing protein [Arthrobacter sp. NyZ413]|uniref:DUF7507 domain-containing protein n=1 Tax=Arthrobacter sp. NyZ413 TaxID=3144669 RepID=UPI003BF8015B